eukprot:5394776-Prymnesium_polylepis.2
MSGPLALPDACGWLCASAVAPTRSKLLHWPQQEPRSASCAAHMSAMRSPIRRRVRRARSA